MIIGINKSEKRALTKALSFSILAFNLLATSSAIASDSIPLPIKKIGLNTSDQVVIQFGSRPGVYPMPPKVLELKGPNHRIVMEFQDTTLDRINMPTPEDLSERIHKLFPAITGVHFMNVQNTAKPTARVIIELPEQLVVQPRVVKLDEDSVTLSLGDDVVEAARELPANDGPTDPPMEIKKPGTDDKKKKGASVGTQSYVAMAIDGNDTRTSLLLAAADAPANAWDWSSTIAPGTPKDTADGEAAAPKTSGTMEVQESTQTFSEPATILQSGSQQVVTPGAAAVLRKPEEEVVKEKTVAEIDNKGFRDLMHQSATSVQTISDNSEAPLQLKPPITTEDSSSTSMDVPAATEPAKEQPVATPEATAVPAAAPAVESAPAVEAAPAAEVKAPESTPVATPDPAPSKPVAEPEISPALESSAPDMAPAQSKPTASTTPVPMNDDMPATTSDEAATPAKTEAAESTPASSAPNTKAQAAVQLYNSAVKAHLSGKLAEAITDYKGALASNPSLSEAHSNLGLIYNQQHNYAQAIIEFRKALAINPKDAITYNGIGAALRAEHDMVGAIKQWQTAVSLDPKLATAHYNLGTAYEIQREYEKSLDAYKAAVKNDYRLGEAYYRMGIILSKTHRVDEAAEQFKTALKISKDAEYSEDAKKRLALIENGSATKTK